MSTRQITLCAVLLLSVLLAAYAVMQKFQSVDMDEKADRMHRETGAVMAGLALEAMDGSGSVLILEPGSELPDSHKQAWLVKQIETFYETLGSDATILGIEKLSLNLSRSRGAGGLTFDRYRSLLKQYPAADVVVSFVGEPAPGRNSRISSQTRFPPMVCFCLSGDHLEKLMDRGVVTCAVVPRRDQVPVSEIKGNWFNVMYRVVTPDTVAEWSSLGE